MPFLNNYLRSKVFHDTSVSLIKELQSTGTEKKIQKRKNREHFVKITYFTEGKKQLGKFMFLCIISSIPVQFSSIVTLCINLIWEK